MSFFCFFLWGGQKSVRLALSTVLCKCMYCLTTALLYCSCRQLEIITVIFKGANVIQLKDYRREDYVTDIQQLTGIVENANDTCCSVKWNSQKKYIANTHIPMADLQLVSNWLEDMISALVIIFVLFIKYLVNVLVIISIDAYVLITNKDSLCASILLRQMCCNKYIVQEH